MGGQGGAGVEGWSDREELFFVELIDRQVFAAVSVKQVFR